MTAASNSEARKRQAEREALAEGTPVVVSQDGTTQPVAEWARAGEPPTHPTYPHDDDQCRQDSIDAGSFREACRAVAALAGALGLPDTGHGFYDVVSIACERLTAEASR